MFFREVGFVDSKLLRALMLGQSPSAQFEMEEIAIEVQHKKANRGGQYSINQSRQRVID